MRIASVILDIPTQALDAPYTYEVPETADDEVFPVAVGCAVLVPFLGDFMVFLGGSRLREDAGGIPGIACILQCSVVRDRGGLMPVVRHGGKGVRPYLVRAFPCAPMSALRSASPVFVAAIRAGVRVCGSVRVRVVSYVFVPVVWHGSTFPTVFPGQLS